MLPLGHGTHDVFLYSLFRNDPKEHYRGCILEYFVGRRKEKET